MTRQGRRAPIDRVCETLRGAMVEALLDAARERRKFAGPLTRQGRKQNVQLVTAAVGHALELADQHLILTGEAM